MGQQWFACESLPRQELRAAVELGVQGFGVLLPQYRRARRRRRQSELGLVLPGYVFVAFDRAVDAWGCVRSTRGVRRLICWPSGQPEALSEREAVWLVDQFGHGPVDDLEVALRPFRAGSALRVLDGPFAGAVGVCERSTSLVARIVLSIFGRPTPFEFPVEAVEVA